MFAKALAGLVVVAALGIGGYTMYTNHGCTGCPFSSSKTASTDCCAAQADCCETASACCADGKLAAASVPDCCFPGSPCCEGDDCCLKTGATKSTAISAVVGVPATVQSLKK